MAREHVGTQSTQDALVREHAKHARHEYVDTQGTFACEHVITQGTLARESAKHVSTSARKRARHIGT